MDTKEIISRLLWGAEEHCNTLSRMVEVTDGREPMANLDYREKLATTAAAVIAAREWMLKIWDPSDAG